MITVKQVTTQKEQKQFVHFVEQLYKGNPFYVPGLLMDEKNYWNLSKNPSLRRVDHKLFLAYQEGKIVGRIGLIVNHVYNDLNYVKTLRLTHFDFIDDLNVSKELLNAAEKYARENHLDLIHGPLGITDLDHQGLLVEGFTEEDLFITIYNHPYYHKHLEAHGYTKDYDWIEFQIMTPDEIPHTLKKISERAISRHGFKLLEFKRRKDILPYAEELFSLYNESYREIKGSTPLNSEQIDYYIKNFFSFVDPDYIKLVLNKDHRIIGFGIALPSLSKAMKKSGGRLFPFGFIHLLRYARNNPILDLYLVGVKPELMATGANAILMTSIIETAIRNGVKIAETGPELEDNEKVKQMWKYFETRQHRRRRIYKKEIPHST